MEPNEQAQVPLLNLPNALTVLRILLVPVFIWVYLLGTTNAKWWALAIFIAAAFTDQLDGHLARKWNLITDFGRLADPLADKALTLSAFFLISIGTGSPWMWTFTILVTIREVGITILREILRGRGTVVAASSGGKLKTVLQILMITLMLVPWSSFIQNAAVLSALNWVFVILGVVTLGITLVSGWQYLVAAIRAGKERVS